MRAILLLCLLWPQFAQAGFQLVQNQKNNNGGGSGGFSRTLTATKQGSLLVAAVSWCCTAGQPVLSDNQSNSWSVYGTPVQDGAADYVAIYYAVGTTAGVTSVSSTAGGNQYVAMSVYEFTGLDTASPTDGAVSTVSGTATSATTPNLTPSRAGDLLFCNSLNDADSSVGTLSAGFTIGQSYGTGATTGLTNGWRIYGSTTIVTCTATYAVSYQNPIIMAAFKAAKIKHKVLTD